MTLKEAYRVLQRFEDWRSGKDRRAAQEAFSTNEHREAIKLILASQGLDKPIADCGRCVHRGLVTACKLRVKGECTKFEEAKGKPS